MAVLVAVILVLALWFKGGEFFCRLRGGHWASPASVCVTH